MNSICPFTFDYYKKMLTQARAEFNHAKNFGIDALLEHHRQVAESLRKPEKPEDAPKPR